MGVLEIVEKVDCTNSEKSSVPGRITYFFLILKMCSYSMKSMTVMRISSVVNFEKKKSCIK